MEDRAARALEKAIGYTFTNRSLLETALTHTSFVKGAGRKAEHNERMEFLGDAVLELIVSEYLFTTHTEMQEGSMTRMRARLVCEQALYSAAVSLGLPDCLRLGHGEAQTGGRGKPSVVSDAMEAVIGAVFLDGGIAEAKRVVLDQIITLLQGAHIDSDDKDFKTRLQEHVQHGHIGRLVYELADATGPDHEKTFTMRVLLSGEVVGVGTGANKQHAGQAAARAALIKLGVLEDTACG